MPDALIAFIPLVILVALAWFVATILRKIAARYPPAAVDVYEKSGVGGWLLLLVLGLTFLGPLMGAGRLNADFMTAEELYPSLLEIVLWSEYKMASWLCFAIIAVLSIYAGRKLLIVRTPSVIRFSIVILWVVGPLASLINAVFLPWLYFGGFKLDANFVGGFIGVCISSILWTAYLLKSRRVKATYGN
jgi:hypothetical protein